MIRKISLIWLCFVTMLSCSDELDMTPENSITFKNGLETEHDVESALNSTQSIVRGSLSDQLVCSMWVRGIYADTTQYTLTRNLRYTE
ncbi:MAG: RagB/SusD family nutrient uptake outer membrane protein, partial [Butyricimonas faecihominis]